MAKKLFSRPSKEVKEEKKLDWKGQLKEIVPRYKDNKAQEARYKKLYTEQNSSIKSIMIAEGVERFEVDDIKVTHTMSESFSFNQEKLIATLKKLGKTDLIKTVEVVDDDALETAIYDDETLAQNLAECQESKQTWTLRLGKVKKDD